MRLSFTALAAAATIAIATAAVPSTASAQCRGPACAGAVGLGILGGAIVGGAIAGSAAANNAYAPAPGYVPYGGYGAPYPAACPGGYWARRPLLDPYGNVVGYSRPRFFCP
jgi:hypothetical protein